MFSKIPSLKFDKKMVRKYYHALSDEVVMSKYDSFFSGEVKTETIWNNLPEKKEAFEILN